MFKKFSTKDMSVEERLDFIEFRQELLFNDTEVDRLLFEYNITKEQYTDIMDIMDKFRNNIDKGNKVNHGNFEQKIYEAIPHLGNDYHFCEYLSRAFKNEGRWEEVFDKLYGHMPKYQGLN